MTGVQTCALPISISGSVNALKSAVSNLIVGFGDADADMELLCNNMVDAFKSEMCIRDSPLTVAIGDSEEMQKAIDMLSEVKESIINAYEIKTGLSRAKLSHLRCV